MDPPAVLKVKVEALPAYQALIIRCTPKLCVAWAVLPLFVQRHAYVGKIIALLCREGSRRSPGLLPAKIVQPEGLPAECTKLTRAKPPRSTSTEHEHTRLHIGANTPSGTCLGRSDVPNESY